MILEQNQAVRFAEPGLCSAKKKKKKALNYWTCIFTFLCSKLKALRHFNKYTQAHMHRNTHMPKLPTSYSIHRCFNRLLFGKTDNTSYAAGSSRLPCSNFNHMHRTASKKNIWHICNTNTFICKELRLPQWIFYNSITYRPNSEILNEQFSPV